MYSMSYNVRFCVQCAGVLFSCKCNWCKWQFFQSGDCNAGWLGLEGIISLPLYSSLPMIRMIRIKADCHLHQRCQWSFWSTLIRIKPDDCHRLITIWLFDCHLHEGALWAIREIHMWLQTTLDFLRAVLGMVPIGRGICKHRAVWLVTYPYCLVLPHFSMLGTFMKSLGAGNLKLNYA